MGFRSNYQELAKALGLLGQAFGVRRQSGKDRRLGDEIADIAAVVIYDRTRNRKLGPDGSPLPELKIDSLKRKVRKGFPPVLGIETGMMLDKAEIRGDVTIYDDTVIMEYGLGEDTKQKAEWFQGGKEHQEARFFYDLGEEGEGKVCDYIDEVAEDARAEFEEG